MTYPELDVILSQLRAGMEGFRAEYRHFLADLFLYHLAFDVLEHSTAAQLLSASATPRAAFANARAAFEAAQEMWILVSDEDLYDHRGCLALAYEQFDRERLQDRYGKGGGVWDDDSETVNAEANVRDEAASLDRVAPGYGKVVLAALAEFQSRKPFQRKYWLGRSRTEEIAAIVSSIDDPTSLLSRQFDAMYGLLSMSSHPQLRAAHRRMETAEDGTIVFSPLESDRTKPGVSAAFACHLALECLKHRRTFQFASNVREE